LGYDTPFTEVPTDLGSNGSIDLEWINLRTGNQAGRNAAIIEAKNQVDVFTLS
jgi:hypothetical protein